MFRKRCIPSPLKLNALSRNDYLLSFSPLLVIVQPLARRAEEYANMWMMLLQLTRLYEKCYEIIASNFVSLLGLEDSPEENICSLGPKTIRLTGSVQIAPSCVEAHLLRCALGGYWRMTTLMINAITFANG